MKYLKTIILFYALFLSTSILIQGCCKENIRIIGDGEMLVTDTLQINIDTINNEFILQLNPETELALHMGNMNFITTSHASSCSYNFRNTIEEESIKLSCNKEFTYSNNVIAPEINFLKTDGISVDIDEFYGWVTVSISFGSAFIQNVNFENDHYEFKLEMETNDHLSISNTASAYMDL